MPSVVMVMLTMLVIVAVVIVLMIMLVVMVMMMIVTMVIMIMRVIVAAAAIRTMHMLGRGPRRTTRLAPRDRLGHQAILFRLRVGVMMMPMVVVIMIVIMVVMIMAMCVVIVVVAMSMVIMVVPVRMVIMVVIVRVAMPVIMMVVAGHAAEAIGAALGLEGRGNEADLRTELLDQFDEHIVVSDAECIRQQLRRRMAIAEMPGDARDDMRIGRAELNQTLRLAAHHDDIAGFELEAIAIDERRRFSEIDEKFGALGARQRTAATAAIVEIEFNRVDHTASIEAAALKGLGRSDHGGHVSNGVGTRSAQPIKHAVRNADRAAHRG